MMIIELRVNPMIEKLDIIEYRNVRERKKTYLVDEMYHGSLHWQDKQIHKAEMGRVFRHHDRLYAIILNTAEERAKIKTQFIEAIQQEKAKFEQAVQACQTLLEKLNDTQADNL